MSEYILYILGAIIFCLTVFLSWNTYLLYLEKNPPIKGGVFACSPNNQCLRYPKVDINKICPITFDTENCNNQCSDPSSLCNQ